MTLVYIKYLNIFLLILKTWFVNLNVINKCVATFGHGKSILNLRGPEGKLSALNNDT